jgi:hypothetical protein
MIAITDCNGAELMLVFDVVHFGFCINALILGKLTSNIPLFAFIGDMGNELGISLDS